MNDKSNLILIFFLFIVACKQNKTDVGTIAGSYFPSESNLERGIVYKYYYHQKRNDSDFHKTDIRYKSYQLKDNSLSITDYNAGYQPIHFQRLNINDNQWLLEEEYRIIQDEMVINKGDTTWYAITQNVLYDWANSTAASVKKIDNNGSILKIVDKQEGIEHKMIDGKDVLIISGEREVEQGESHVHIHFHQYFTKNIGMTKAINETENGVYEFQLAEVFDIVEWKKQQLNQEPRIGFIDTTEILNGTRKIEICNGFERINDYYNDQRAQFPGGKGNLWEYLSNKIDKKLVTEDGYLSFHFIVNCHGEAGYFTTVESSLDYKAKKFKPALVSHIHELLLDVKDWESLSVREVARDAYTYLTLKIKDGKIIELLP